MKRVFTRIVVSVFVMIFCLVAVSANEVHIEASEYLSSYSASVDASGSGKISIGYTVSSYAQMTQIGASEIVVQQKVGSSWSSVKYYDAATTSGLLAANRAFYTHTVTYQGIAGQSYRAVVTFYAGDNTGHDTRDYTTSSVMA